MSDELKHAPAEQRPKGRVVWSKDRIRALREHLGYTQREMADELEVRQQTISEWETGYHVPHRSTQKTLSMIAERAKFTYSVSSEQREETEGEEKENA